MDDYKKIIKIAMARTDTNARRLSVALGKSSNYITNILNRECSPTVDTLRDIANALECDLQLCFVDRKTGKIIEP